MDGFAWTLFWPGDTEALKAAVLEKKKKQNGNVFSHKKKLHITEGFLKESKRKMIGGEKRHRGRLCSPTIGDRQLPETVWGRPGIRV